MGWFWRKKKPRETSPRKAASAAAQATSSSGNGELFSTSEDGDRPVELSGDLEVRAAQTATRYLGEALRDLREQMRDMEAECALDVLDEVERSLSSDRLVLPPMPETVLRIQQLLDSPDCNMDRLAEEIERDPALATKAVGIANSPFYAGMDSIGSVRQALVRIGLREVRNIVLVISLRSKVFRVPGFESVISEMWQHSLAASLAAQELAAISGQDPETARLLGLIHDSGRVVFLMLVGSRLRTRTVENPALLRRIESGVHEPLGALLAESWNLAPELVAALAHHHAPERAPEASRATAELLAAADALARAIIGPQETLADRVLDDEVLQAACAKLGLDADAVLAIADEVAESLEPLAKLL